ncbi:MAG: hypothetical protein R6X12_04200 [bacterium]
MRRKPSDARFRQESERLRQENAVLSHEAERLVDASVITRATYDQRFRLVAFGSSRLPVQRLCRLLRVRRSSYYAWQARCGQYERRPQIPARA